MRILILEDDALIAMDLEDIVSHHTGADIVHAATVEQAFAAMAQPFDFALLDLNLGYAGQTSIAVAEQLRAWNTPFCFVSANVEDIPADMRGVAHVRKPFHPRQIERALPSVPPAKSLPRYAKPESGAWALVPRT